MELQQTPIPGLFVAETRKIGDQRGFFARLFCEAELAEAIGTRKIVQVNQSHTADKGAIRGLHYQYPPHAEMKMVRCLKGCIWDVAVDIRAGSPTFLQWYARELTPENATMMLIPEGFAHGFQVLAPDSEILYLTTARYAPDAEGAVAYDDPAVGIAWPLEATVLSERDRRHPHITPDFSGVSLG